MSEDPVWGYIHNLAFEGKWHMLRPDYRYTLCELGFFNSPGAHVDYTEPDEDGKCAHCLSIAEGLSMSDDPRGKWRWRHPNAFDFMYPHHVYRCGYPVNRRNHKCARVFLYRTEADIPCKGAQPCVGTEYKLEHMCCDGKKPPRRDQEESGIYATPGKRRGGMQPGAFGRT